MKSNWNVKGRRGVGWASKEQLLLGCLKLVMLGKEGAGGKG